MTVCAHQDVKNMATFDMPAPFYRCNLCGEFGVNPSPVGDAPAVAAADVSQKPPGVLQEIRAYLERAEDGTLRVVIPLADIERGDG